MTHSIPRIATLLAVVFLGIASYGHAKQHRAQTQINTVLNPEISDLKGQVSGLKANLQSMQNSLQDANSQVKNLTEQVTSLNTEMKIVEFVGAGVAFVLGVFVSAIITKLVQSPHRKRATAV